MIGTAAAVTEGNLTQGRAKVMEMIEEKDGKNLNPTRDTLIVPCLKPALSGTSTFKPV